MRIRTSLLTIVLFSFIFSGCATTSTSQNNLSTPDNKYSYDGKLNQDQKHLKNHNFMMILHIQSICQKEIWL